MNEGKQMTEAVRSGASSAAAEWNAIDWRRLEADVFRLQTRIAQAVRQQRWGRAKALQWLLTHSRSAKLLAVRRVKRNRGASTPGVDGVRWRSPAACWYAAASLQHRGYRAQPLRRIYIPKKNGKLRPLGIPTLHDRALQALHLLALEPVAETQTDRYSFGFRRYRSTADAIEQCHRSLSRRHSATWVLEGDIKACFDGIDHDWLRRHVCVDRRMLEQWLSCGYVEQHAWFPTHAGTPQGGIISPTLANLALDGLERAVHAAVPRHAKVNVVRYADDFIVTGDTPALLAQTVKPAISAFLAERGLTLSEEKTRITSIFDGFDFLGFNLRKYGQKLLTKPAKANVRRFLEDTAQDFHHRYRCAADMIKRLNARIRGWANYYRHVVASRVFNVVDHVMFQRTWHWIRRRHPNKSAAWRKQHYYVHDGARDWIFAADAQTAQGVRYVCTLFRAGLVRIRRHCSIRAAATPFDPAFFRYFEERKARGYPSARRVHAHGKA